MMLRLPGPPSLSMYEYSLIFSLKPQRRVLVKRIDTRVKHPEKVGTCVNLLFFTT